MALFLSLFFLLLRGSDHLYVHASHNHYAPAKLTQKSEHASLDGLKKNQPQVRQSVSSNSDDDDLIATEEVEDDNNSVPSRKYIEISNYFLNFFYHQVTVDFIQYLKDCLPFCKHFSYTSSYKYLIYHVIRV